METQLIMNTALISAFLTYTLITAMTPGPNNILALSSVHTFGFKRSTRVLAGMSAGFLIIMLICALFTYTLINIIPSVSHWLKMIGAAYVVWLAIKIAKSDPTSPYSKGISLSFWTSFWLQFANVKIILYGITALSTFVLPYTKDALWVISVSVLLAIIGTVGNVCWAAAGHLFQAIFRHYGRALNIVLSGLLFWVAIDMLI
ncbi:ABC transporter [Yersinia kristensenii]|nr:ABC transporter [Yersinia kristensenii]